MNNPRSIKKERKRKSIKKERKRKNIKKNVSNDSSYIIPGIAAAGLGSYMLLSHLGPSSKSGSGKPNGKNGNVEDDMKYEEGGEDLIAKKGGEFEKLENLNPKLDKSIYKEEYILKILRSGMIKYPDDDNIDNLEKVSGLIEIEKEELNSIDFGNKLNYMFHGPPGTGKTMMAQAIAKSNNVPIILPTGLKSKWTGESEKNVQALYLLAKNIAPCVVFIDEADQFLYNRGTSETDSSSSNLTNSFLPITAPDVSNKDKILWICATNNLLQIDPAIIDRFRPVMLDKLTEDAVKEIITRSIDKLTKDKDQREEIIIKIMSYYKLESLRTLLGRVGKVEKYYKDKSSKGVAVENAYEVIERVFNSKSRFTFGKSHKRKSRKSCKRKSRKRKSRKSRKRKSRKSRKRNN
jgi:SpoVK/Ycf46/Vps4 family AAA+-type ATPase